MQDFKNYSFMFVITILQFNIILLRYSTTKRAIKGLIATKKLFWLSSVTVVCQVNDKISKCRNAL